MRNLDKLSIYLVIRQELLLVIRWSLNIVLLGMCYMARMKIKMTRKLDIMLMDNWWK
jgi:hypothetical protein